MQTILLSSNGIEEVKFLQALSDHEETHPIVKIAGIDTWLRARSEMLVLSDDMIFLTRKKKGLCSDMADSGFIYDVPGGGWLVSEDHFTTAIRETEEEARIKTKNAIYGGAYVVIRTKAHPWVQENVPKEYIWKGYYSEVYVSEYDGNFTGDIAERDLDPDMAEGDWYPIDDFIDLLCPVHQIAIRKYLSMAR